MSPLSPSLFLLYFSLSLPLSPYLLSLKRLWDHILLSQHNSQYITQHGIRASTFLLNICFRQSSLSANSVFILISAFSCPTNVSFTWRGGSTFFIKHFDIVLVPLPFLSLFRPFLEASIVRRPIASPSVGTNLVDLRNFHAIMDSIPPQTIHMSIFSKKYES